MTYWDKTKASRPARNLAKHSHIEVTKETKEYRQCLLSQMIEWREIQIRKAHARMMAERKVK